MQHSSDGRFFLDRVEGRYQLRETVTGRVLRELETDDRFPDFGYLSPDAACVLLCNALRDGYADVLRLHDIKTGKTTGAIKAQDRVSEPAFSPSGRLVAWADRGGDIHLHHAPTGKPIRILRSTRPLPLSKLDIVNLFFSPSGDSLIERRFALPNRVFDVSSGREIARFFVNPKETNPSVRFSPIVCSNERCIT